MGMKTYHDLKDMLCEELEEVTRKGELTAGSLDVVDKLTHSIKSLDTIIAMERYNDDDGESGFYPQRYYYDDGTYRGRSMRGEMRSNARRRDAMGRYSRDDARHEMMDNLRDLMDNAPDERMRKKIGQFMREIENE